MFPNKWKGFYEEAQEEIEELEETIEELTEEKESLEEIVSVLEEKLKGSAAGKLEKLQQEYAKLQEELEQAKTYQTLTNEKTNTIGTLSTQLKNNSPDQKDAEIKKLQAQIKSNEIAHGKLIKEKDGIIEELSRNDKTQLGTYQPLPTEEDLGKIDKNELIALIFEMKTRLEVSETFETIHKIDKYLEEFSILFQCSDLIQAIEPESDFPELLQGQKVKALKKVNNFLPVGKQVTRTKEAKTIKENLKASLEERRKEMRNKVNSLGLSALFNDNTLEKYFTLSKMLGDYSVDSFISFEEHETILIPERFRGKPIVNLQEKLFYNCKTIKNIIIEAPLTILPAYCFYNSSLESVVLPDSIESFSPSSVSGGNGIFEGSSISEIILPDKLTTIPSNTFRCCKALKTVMLNKNLTQIDKSAFFSCSSLSEITLPNRLAQINSNTFFNCSSLSKVTLPNSLTHLKYSAFDECNSLKELTIPRSVKHIENSQHYIKTNRVIKCFPGSYAQQWARENGYPMKNAEED